MSPSRRQLLKAGLGGSLAVLAGTSAVSSQAYTAPRRLGNPFSLGVASGDPTPGGVVLWTRLAPDPFEPGGFGGLGRNAVTVEYEVAHDEHFRQVVRRGSAVATADLAHSVHPEVHGLEPDRWYFYRFRAGTAISPTGRTRTAPAPGSHPEQLRFVFASCQAWNDGFYTAYEHMAAEDLDLVVHLGDYIYEDAITAARRGAANLEPQFRREARDLAGYRLHYALYKAEPALQRVHALFPWLVTMDDHEVDDNWAAESPVSRFDIDVIPAAFRRRRAAAFQAMYEHQPLRLAQMPSGPSVRMHRRYGFGELADFTMLDTRQYRSRQVPGSAAGYLSREAQARTMLGAQQRDWLLDGFSRATAKWQVIGNQVVMGHTDHDPGPADVVSTDAWDGYVADRNAVLAAAAGRGVRNLVVISGDRHENYAADLRRDFADAESPVVASEFTGTSITSGGDGVDMYDHGQRLLAANPGLKFFNGQRGYVRVEVTERLWRSDFRVLPYVERPGAPISTRASYVVEDQHPGVREASRAAAPQPPSAELGAGEDRASGGHP